MVYLLLFWEGVVDFFVLHGDKVSSKSSVYKLGEDLCPNVVCFCWLRWLSGIWRTVHSPHANLNPKALRSPHTARVQPK